MGSVTATYHIPKAKIPVRVLLRNRTLHRLELFVPLQEARKPPERVVQELLEQPRSFFPGRDQDTGDFLLVQRDAVLWAAVERQEGQELEALELYDRHVWVRVDLEDGSRLEGELFYSAPTARARVMDHLNGPERFFFLHRPDRLVLVNKAYVVYVVEQPGDAQAPLRFPGAAQGDAETTEARQVDSQKRDNEQSDAPKKDYELSDAPKKDYELSDAPKKDYELSDAPKKDYEQSVVPKKDNELSNVPKKGNELSNVPKKDNELSDAQEPHAAD